MKTRERSGSRGVEGGRVGGDEAFERAVGARQHQLAGGRDAHGSSSGTPSIRRSRHERSASSASWIPLAPSIRSLQRLAGHHVAQEELSTGS